MARCYGQTLKQEGWVRPRTNGILESSLYVDEAGLAMSFNCMEFNAIQTPP